MKKDMDQLSAKLRADTTVYHNITLVLPRDNISSSDDDDEEREQCTIKKLARTTTAGISNVLHRYGCDFVEDPETKELVDFATVSVKDGMKIVAEQPEKRKIEKQVTVLDNWQTSMSIAHEQESAMAMYNELCMKYPQHDVRLLNVRKVKSLSGKSREVDGMALVVGTRLLVGVVEAKTKVNMSQDIKQLLSLLDFLKTERLVDNTLAAIPAAELHGYLAYKVAPENAQALEELRKECAAHSIGLLFTSGHGMQLH